MASQNMLNGLSKQQALLLLDGLYVLDPLAKEYEQKWIAQDVHYLSSQLRDIVKYHDEVAARDAERIQEGK